jgi:predicted PurR-regulated permease PerM
MHDALQRLSRAPLYKRLIALALFFALLVGFRHLALLFVTFIILARGFGFLGNRVGTFLGRSERIGVIVVLVLMGTLLGLGIWGVVHAGGRFYDQLVTIGEGRPLTEMLMSLQEDLLRRLPAWLPLEGLKHKAPELIEPAMTYLRATGRTLLQVLIGLILAILYLLDREPVDTLLHDVPEEGISGHLRRYLGYLCEAVVITITLQVLVALINTVLTVPVLWALGLPHKVAFTLLIFISSLVPVVGNLVSGAVLIAASYAYKGVVAVIIFLVTTFILHKIEAYFLNPRLAARHVKLPALILIISLILFEHMFGIIGLFLSFPALYVGLNVLRDIRGAIAAGEAVTATEAALALNALPTATIAPPPAPPAPLPPVSPKISPPLAKEIPLSLPPKKPTRRR